MCASNVNAECPGNKVLRCSYNIYITASAFSGSDDNKQYDDDDDDTKRGELFLLYVIFGTRAISGT
jgi:hypothetical protein